MSIKILFIVQKLYDAPHAEYEKYIIYFLKHQHMGLEKVTVFMFTYKTLYLKKPSPVSNAGRPPRTRNEMEHPHAEFLRK